MLVVTVYTSAFRKKSKSKVRNKEVDDKLGEWWRILVLIFDYQRRHKTILEQTTCLNGNNVQQVYHVVSDYFYLLGYAEKEYGIEKLSLQNDFEKQNPNFNTSFH